MSQHTKPVDVTAFGDAIAQWLALNGSQQHVQLRIYPVRKYGSTRRMNRNDWVTTTTWMPVADRTVGMGHDGEVYGHSMFLMEHLLDQDEVLQRLTPGESYGVEGRSADGMTIIASCYIDLPGENPSEGSSSKKKAKEEDDDSLEGVLKQALKRKLKKVVERTVNDDEDEDAPVVGGLRLKGGLIPMGNGTFVTPEQFQLQMSQTDRRLEERDADTQRLEDQITELREKLEGEKNSTGKLMRETLDKTVKLGFLWFQNKMKRDEEGRQEKRRGGRGKGKGGRGGRGGRRGPSPEEMEEMLAAMEDDDYDEMEEDDEELPPPPRGRGRGRGASAHPWATSPSSVSGSSMPPPPYAETTPAPTHFDSGFRAASGPPPPGPVSPFSTVLDDDPADESAMPPPADDYPNLFGGVSGPPAPVPTLAGTRDPIRPVTARHTPTRNRAQQQREDVRSSVERLAPVAADIVAWVESLMGEVSFVDLEDVAKEQVADVFVERCRVHGMSDTEILLLVSNSGRLADLLIRAMTEEMKEDLGDFVVARIHDVILEKASSTDWNKLLR